jgi:hypothetical protein
MTRLGIDEFVGGPLVVVVANRTTPGVRENVALDPKLPFRDAVSESQKAYRGDSRNSWSKLTVVMLLCDRGSSG